MDRQLVALTNIASIGYDKLSEILEVEFSNGTVYQYYNIGAALFEHLMQTRSKGQFLNAYIKNTYLCSKIG